MATTNHELVQQTTLIMKNGESIMTTARRIVDSWPKLRESVHQPETNGSNLDETGDESLQIFTNLISLLDQLTAEAKVPITQTEPATGEHGTLPLQRFLDTKDEWQTSMERESTNGGPDSELDAEPPNGKHSAETEKAASLAASSLSLVTDSALSTAVSDETVVLDKATIENHKNKRLQLDEATLRDLNEKLCRIITSGQTTKNILARATDLIDAGADVNARDEWCDGTIYDQLWLDHQTQKGWQRATVLYGAVSSRADTAVIRLLLNKGADINKRGGFNATPLHAIIQTDEKEIARLLLNRGADMNAEPGGFGCNALTLAAGYGTMGTSELLIERGADVTGADSENGTALHAAAYRGHVGMIKLLLDHGALIDAQLKDTGMTPLAEAVKMAHDVAVQTLLARGADGQLLGPKLTTYADVRTRERLLEILKEYGADYVCSGPEIPRPPPALCPVYYLVRQGDARAAAAAAYSEDISAFQRAEEPVTKGKTSLQTQAPRAANRYYNTNNGIMTSALHRQIDETEPLASSSQTTSTSTTKTERKKSSKKFWSRFSSQTTLHDNHRK